MNEIAAAQSLNFQWVFGIIFVVFSVLVGVIWRSIERRLHKLEDCYVSKETLDRVERTWRDAIDSMIETRKEMHEENKEKMNEIKDSISDIHRRIDEEFREQRKRQPQH
jgi:flagellar biosynthesis/type III secretory pathway M-ring protein FliF/YscJ